MRGRRGVLEVHVVIVDVDGQGEIGDVSAGDSF